MVTTNALNITAAGIVKYDGAGSFTADTVTQHDLLIGGAANAITSLALTNGQLAIGSTGADPVAASITAGTGITVTPGAGTITIASTVVASAAWTFVAGTTQAAVANNYYAATNAGQTTFTLPATAAQGTVLAFLATTAAGWTLVENTGQSIQVGSSVTTTTTGSVTTTAIGDIIYLVCSTANTKWFATGEIGNLTIV